MNIMREEVKIEKAEIKMLVPYSKEKEIT